MAARIFDARSRNRALLARQLLLERVSARPESVVERLVGTQAQTPRSPYTALWSRIRDFDPLVLSRAIEERRLVRIALMRSTIHLVTAADAMTLRPLVLAILQRELTNPTWRRPLERVDLESVAVHARRILEAEALTPAKLGVALADHFPDIEPRALAHAARTMLPLVQIPPRALWQRSGATTLTTAEHWLGRDVRTDASWDEIALRYLAAFGPARPADLVAWSRVTGMVEVFERLRPQLRVLRDERGKELFDVPRAPRPPKDVPAPPRFLPDFDNVLLAHADRTFVFADEHRTAIQGTNGVLPGTLLVDGTVAAAWNVEADDGHARLMIRALKDIPRAEQDGIRAEGLGLLRFLHAAAKHEVVLG